MNLETVKNNAAVFQTAAKSGNAEIRQEPINNSTVKTDIPLTANTNKSNGKDEKNKENINSDKLKTAVQLMNNKIKPTSTRCEFTVDDTTNRVAIKVIDKQTDKVIKEIPTEETLEMIAKVWELAGLLVDQKM